MRQCHHLQPMGSFPLRKERDRALLQALAWNPLGLPHLQDPHGAGCQTRTAAKASFSPSWLVLRRVVPAAPSHTPQREGVPHVRGHTLREVGLLNPEAGASVPTSHLSASGVTSPHSHISPSDTGRVGRPTTRPALVAAPSELLREMKCELFPSVSHS